MSNNRLKFLPPKLLAFVFIASSSLHGQSFALKARYTELEEGRVVPRENVNLPTVAQFVGKSEQIVTLVDVSILEQKLVSILNAHPDLSDSSVKAVSILLNKDGTGITSRCSLDQQRMNEVSVTIKARVNQTKVAPDLSWFVDEEKKTDSPKAKLLKKSLANIQLIDLVKFQVVNKTFDRFVSKRYLSTSSVRFVRDKKRLKLKIVFDTKNKDVFEILEMLWESQNSQK